jgi:hypothetical protein
MWSSGQSPGFNSQCYQIFWEAISLEQGPLSLMRINEQLLEWKIAAPIWKTEINGCGGLSHWPQDTPLSAKVGNKIRQPAVAQSV